MTTYKKKTWGKNLRLEIYIDGKLIEAIGTKGLKFFRGRESVEIDLDEFRTLMAFHNWGRPVQPFTRTITPPPPTSPTRERDYSAS